jgi:hypothetical protein
MMPCHHALAEALHAYIAAAGIAANKKAFLFRTASRRISLTKRRALHLIGATSRL